MAAKGGGVGFAYAVQVGLAIIVFFLFSWLRLQKWLRRFYSPKRFDKSLPVKPKRLPPGFFSWWWTIFQTTEDELIEVAGMDAAMVVRMLNFCLEVFATVSIWCLIVVLPTNLSGGAVKDAIRAQNFLATISPPPPSPPHPPPFPPPPFPPEDSLMPASPPPPDCDKAGLQPINRQLSYFDLCSISNIPQNSRKLWVHLISVWVVSCVILRILWRYNSDATLLRILFLGNSPRGGPSHTVLVTDIPGMEEGTIRSFARKYVGGSLFVMLPKKTRQRILDWLEEGYDKVGDKLDVRQVASKIVDKEEEEVPDFVKNDPLAAAAAKRRENAISKDDKKLDVWAFSKEELMELQATGDDMETVLKTYVHRELDYCYGPGQVAAINPVWDQSALDKLLGEYNKVKRSLEEYLDAVAYKLRRRQVISKRHTIRVVGTTMGSWGIARYGLKPKKVDAIEHWTARLQQLNVEIEAAQKKALTKPIPSTFITFNTRAAAVRAANALHYHSESDWCSQAAPEPREVVWENLCMRKWQRGCRSFILWMVYMVVTAFYIFPVVFVQGIVNLDNLGRLLGIDNIGDIPFVSEFLQSVLPTSVMVLFLSFVPYFLRLMCLYSGMTSVSEIDIGVIRRFFYFQVVVVFIFNMISGSIINQIDYFIHNLDQILSIVRTLGVSIPQTATFFICYILTAGVARTSLQFLRIGDFIIFWALSRLASTPRARARMWADVSRTHGGYVPFYTMGFMLGALYSVINPIMCPTVLLYFLIAVLCEKYLWLYTFKSKYETGGLMWGEVFNHFMASLYIFQIFLLILLSIKGLICSFLIVPLIFVTFIFHMVVYSNFDRPWTIMSVHDAALLDLKDKRDQGGEGMSEEELRDIREMYLSPVFKVRPGDIDNLLHEAAVTSGLIDGKSVEDVEQQLEDAGYESAEEADDDVVASALEAKAEMEVAAAMAAARSKRIAEQQSTSRSGWSLWGSSSRQPAPQS